MLREVSNKGTAIIRPPSKTSTEPVEPKIVPKTLTKKQKKKYVDTTNIDQAIRPNVPGVKFAPSEVKNEIDQIKQLLNKLKSDRQLLNGVSSYNPNYNAILPNVHGVIIKKPRPLSTKRELEIQKIPGPGKYHQDDSVIKPNQPAFTFKKQTRGTKTPPPDKRSDLIVDLNVIKKRPKVAKILPEHAPAKKQLDEIKVGPGAYKLSHKITEPRQDIGGVKYVASTEHSTSVDDRPALEPDFDYDKPNKGVPLYKPPSEIEPKNVPDKVLYPEHWKYYDLNLDAIKEVQQPHDFAQNMKLDEFMSRDQFLKELDEFKLRHEKKPDIYSYDYEQPDTKIHYDFGKLQPRFKYEDPDLAIELDNAGDVLILDGDKPKKRVPGFDIQKMQGRFNDDILVDDAKDDQVLDLNPKYDLVKKRPITLVDMEKDSKHYDLDKVEPSDLVEINFIPDGPIKDPSEPKVISHNFGKASDRFKKQGLIDDETKEELILNPDPIKPNKGVSTFGKAETRFRPPKVPIDPWHDEQPVTDIIKDRDNFDKHFKQNSEGHYFNRDEKLKDNRRQETNQKKYDKKQYKKWVN